MLPLLSRAAGIGNSPPARNFAVSPDTAVRLGSASKCTRPTFSNAVSMPEALLGLRQEVALVALVVAVGAPPVMVCTVDATPLVMVVTVLLPVEPVEDVLVPPVGKKAPPQDW